jgi:archaellin
MATSTDNLTVTRFILMVRMAVFGKSVDWTPNDGIGRNKVVMSLISQDACFSHVKWCCNTVGQGNGNSLLESGQQVEITLDMDDLGEDFSNPWLRRHDDFTIQLKPAIGATLTVERSLPAVVTSTMNLC